MKIAIVGAGVIGLTAAVRLREAGHEVVIHAERTTPNTPASDRAAAIWYPWRVWGHREQRWASESYQELSRLSRLSGSAVLHNDLLEYFDSEPGPDPWWSTLVRHFEHLPPEKCPPGIAAGIRVSTLVIDVPSYMPYLHRRVVDELGCSIVVGRVEDLADLRGYGMVVNCAGLDGGRLAGEGDRMFPRYGHTVRISALPQATPCVLHEFDERELTYVIPRSGDCLLGGTDYPDHDADDPAGTIAERIRQRCTRFVPEIEWAQVLETRVGARPGRRNGEIRLDGPRVCAGNQVIHCLGHGGVGHTLAWGCAKEIVDRVEGRIGAC